MDEDEDAEEAEEADALLLEELDDAELLLLLEPCVVRLSSKLRQHGKHFPKSPAHLAATFLLMQ